jgi:hypothetical protein
MATGNVTDWQGAMTEIGPLYPFPGLEMVLVIVGLVFWIGWHIWQARMETSNYNDDMETLKRNGNMERALKGEKILRSM